MKHRSKKDKIVAKFLDQARQHIIKELVAVGFHSPEQPDPPYVEGFPPEVQSALKDQYQKELDIFHQLMKEIDKFARAITAQRLREARKKNKDFPIISADLSV